MKILFAKVARQSTLNEVTEDLQLVGKSKCVLACCVYLSFNWIFTTTFKFKVHTILYTKEEKVIEDDNIQLTQFQVKKEDLST